MRCIYTEGELIYLFGQIHFLQRALEAAQRTVIDSFTSTSMNFLFFLFFKKPLQKT
jgi:hypothetical protein